MKIKNKGKVYPSPSSSSSSSSDVDFFSVLNLLPAAILALVSVLAAEDREVLAYMMTRSAKTSAASFPSPSQTKRKPSKKPLAGGCTVSAHMTPAFNCDCFDCYTSYWFRWDSSSNRELIHQAIEAFEDQLASGERPSKSSGKGKRRERIGRRASEKPLDVPPPEVALPEIDEGAAISLSCETGGGSEVKEEEKAVEVIAEVAADEDAAVVVRTPAGSSHKGLARKVLPDVLGLFNSRLWSLWGPN